MTKLMQSLISTSSSPLDAMCSKEDRELSNAAGDAGRNEDIELEAALAACIAEFGTLDEDIEVDTEALAVSHLANEFRSQIRNLIAHRKIGVRELARKLNVKAPTVSKFLNSNNDTKLSSWAVLAHALNAEFRVSLQDHLTSQIAEWQVVHQLKNTENSPASIANEIGHNSWGGFQSLTTQNCHMNVDE